MVGFNVADFRSIIGEKGLARPNKFMVRFYLPSGLYGTLGYQQDLATMRFLSYWAEAVSIPSFGVATTQAARYGYGAVEKRPVALQFPDLQVMIMADDNGDNWRIFYRWLNLIINARMNQGITGKTGQTNVLGLQSSVLAYAPYELAYRVEFVTDLEIMTFAQTGEQLATFILREAFPIAMGGVDLNWNDVGSFLRIPVTFAYTDLTMGQPMDQSMTAPAVPLSGLPPLK